MTGVQTCALPISLYDDVGPNLLAKATHFHLLRARHAGFLMHSVSAQFVIGRGLDALSRMEWKNSAQVLVVSSADPNLRRNCEDGRLNAASIPSVS